jgi:leader peptidase (prepilin peptidase) / N-methyltransferase
MTITIEWLWPLALSIPLSAIVWTDARRQVIPNALTLLVAIGGAAYALAYRPATLPTVLLAALVTYAVLLAVRAVYFGMRGHHGLGMGDVKLLAAAALWVGPAGISWVVLAACASAAILILVLRLFGARLDPSARMPFGPHIALGLAVVLVANATWQL